MTLCVMLNLTKKKKKLQIYFYSAHTLITASVNPTELKFYANILMK